MLPRGENGSVDGASVPAVVRQKQIHCPDPQQEEPAIWQQTLDLWTRPWAAESRLPVGEVFQVRIIKWQIQCITKVVYASTISTLRSSRGNSS